MPDGHDDIESYWEGLRPPPAPFKEKVRLAVETGMAAAMNQRVGAGGTGSNEAIGAIVTGAGVHGWHASPGGGGAEEEANPHPETQRTRRLIIEAYQRGREVTQVVQHQLEDLVQREITTEVRAEIQQRLEVALRELLRYPSRRSYLNTRISAVQRAQVENLVNAFAELGMPIVGELTVTEDHRTISISFLNPNVDVDDSGGTIDFTLPLDVSGT